ncbi:hypothetical protein LEP1GSC161_1418 [Leptospira santarosai str. CBC1416]|uniref:Uncharacterized protein n=1 Tax=Leptospira santarosai str. CBC1416 TaxID=1193059 RepID=M6VI42_9LEPT|nr:hypothetical protein LEP1GSC161_1418 [Leptospira santarosai str. CBC1416]
MIFFVKFDSGIFTTPTYENNTISLFQKLKRGISLKRKP